METCARNNQDRSAEEVAICSSMRDIRRTSNLLISEIALRSDQATESPSSVFPFTSFDCSRNASSLDLLSTSKNGLSPMLTALCPNRSPKPS